MGSAMGHAMGSLWSIVLCLAMGDIPLDFPSAAEPAGQSARLMYTVQSPADVVVAFFWCLSTPQVGEMVPWSEQQPGNAYCAQIGDCRWIVYTVGWQMRNGVEIDEHGQRITYGGGKVLRDVRLYGTDPRRK
jgi:hypothetical protein